jgi:hypothetical protein
MTVADFERVRPDLWCRHCGSRDLEIHHSGPHVGLRCPACRRGDPILGVVWLKHTRAKQPA